MPERFDEAVLLVIDVQNDFCPGGSLPVPEGDKIVPLINKIMERFGAVVATADWHPENHVSFASRHKGKRPFDSIEVNGIKQVLWPDHCIQGSQGADFHPKLDTRHMNLILHKGTKPDLDSYSAFFENDRTTSTGLEYYLKGLGRGDVYVCGLAMDVCVFYTIMDSVKLGFKTFLIQDASRGIDSPKGSIEKAKSRMKEAGVGLIRSEELL